MTITKYFKDHQNVQNGTPRHFEAVIRDLMQKKGSTNSEVLMLFSETYFCRKDTMLNMT